MEQPEMNGQWIGKASAGDGTGTLIVNIDKRDSRYEGLAYIHDDDPEMPISVALIQTKDLSPSFKFRAPINPVDPDSSQLVALG